ncbi:MAG TPA: hypothetical protein VF014_07175 [Casimicrobiaceae bacterium]|nr:hypothetical protein [Casimicrobiaceae bacterium]
MIAGADFVVDAETGAHYALAALELSGVVGAHATLAHQLAGIRLRPSPTRV